MAFPNPIVEVAFNNDYGEGLYAQTGWTEITQFIRSMSASTLRGRQYELGRAESGQLEVVLDNADKRFTSGSTLSPYWPDVRSHRRLRVRGKNMTVPNVATGGGDDHSTVDFWNPDTTGKVTSPVLGTHDPAILSAVQTQLEDTTVEYHIEGTVASGATAGDYNVLGWWGTLEQGVRLTHSAYLWKVSGTEPGSTVLSLEVHYFDANGVEIGTTDTVSLTSPTPTTPTRVVITSLPPMTAKYGVVRVKCHLASAPGTALVYAVTGFQTELPEANLAPNISGYWDLDGWYPTPSASKSMSKAGLDAANTYVLMTWAGTDIDCFTDIPHLIPGNQYSIAAQVYKTGGPDVMVSVDDGQSGATLSANTSWTTVTLTFIASLVNQRLRFIPQGTPSTTLRIRRLKVVEDATGAGATLATAGDDSNVTAWEEPNPVFEGWVEGWATKVGGGIELHITVLDRLKEIGGVILSNVLRETLFYDSADLIIPLTEALTAGPQVSELGTWADDSGSAYATLVASRGALLGATYQLGVPGPTDETALQLNRADVEHGYMLYVPWSRDYVAPVALPPPPPVTPPPPAGKQKYYYTKTYWATWSQTYSGDTGAQISDAHIYQGLSDPGVWGGNRRSLIGFNDAAIRADLAGASVTGISLTLRNLHWWAYAGGDAYIGTSGYGSKPGSWPGDVYGVRRVKSTGWGYGAQRTVGLPLFWGTEFASGYTRGITLGWGDGDHKTYGFFAGAGEGYSPYLTISYWIER